MTSETPDSSPLPTSSIESGFLLHPGDKQVIKGYMGVVMPDDDASRYDNGGEDSDYNPNEYETSLVTTESAEQKKGEVVTALDKLRVIQEQFGFVPHTREELNEIWRVRKHLDKFGGSAADLNILLIHQSDPEINTDDPTALLRKKVRTWGDYYQETIRNKTFIHDVAEFTAKYPEMSTSDVLDYYKRTVSYAESALRPIKAGGVLSELATKTDDVEASIAKNPFLHVDAIWEGSLDKISRNEFKDIGNGSNQMNNKRHDFWRSILGQARRHDVVRLLVSDYIGPERPPDR